MATLSMKTGTVSSTFGMSAYTHIAPQPAQTTPNGLYPLVARAYVLDEYRMMSGWPVPIPAFDIQVESVVSLGGVIVSSRPDPTAIQTNAYLRWTAHDGYDQDHLKWNPVKWTQSPLPIDLVTDHDPALKTDYEYRIHDERFSRSAVVLVSENENYLNLDLNSELSGQGITVLMVLAPNNPPNGACGLFSNSGGLVYTSAYIQGQYVYVATESQAAQRAAPISPALNSNAPLYLAMVLDRPYATLYSGQGPSSVQQVVVPTGDNGVFLNYRWIIGAFSDLSGYADMALFDIGVYTQRLSLEEAQVEFSLLSQTYGGDT